MRATVAFVGGALAGALLHRLLKSLQPRQRTTFKAPEGAARAGSPAFGEELAALTHTVSEGGNALRLFDGTHGYVEELLDAVGRARGSIWLEIFWWRDGSFAAQMTDALLAAHERGVHIRIIVDGFGAQNGRAESLATLRDAGAEVAVFAPVRPWMSRRLNKRTHRRILVIDHQVGYTGGVGIDDRWLGHKDDPPWADVLLRIEGPAVRRLAAVFADHWRVVTGDPLAGEKALRGQAPAGDAKAQVLHSGPETGNAGMRLAMLYAVEAAREKVRISTPYFIPDRLLVDRLVACRRRGVDVELLLPSSCIDLPIVRRASRTTWGPLLRAGVRILEHQPTLVHTKALLIDDAWALIGSMNMDERSFRLNSEIAVGTDDAGTVRALGTCMDRYRDRSVPISLEDWEGRPVRQRAGDGTAGLLWAQL